MQNKDHGGIPVAFSFFEVRSKLSTVHQELLGDTAPEDAGTPQTPLII